MAIVKATFENSTQFKKAIEIFHKNIFCSISGRKEILRKRKRIRSVTKLEGCVKGQTTIKYIGNKQEDTEKEKGHDMYTYI